MKLKSKGFTIIEVLIVLAIAGVIILAVLIAVPTLQRNSRNSGRTSEASRIAALVNQCLANRNGVVTSCDDAGEIQYLVDDFQQLNTDPTFSTTAPVGDVDGGSTTGTEVNYSAQCTTAGDFAVASTSGTRSFTVLFFLEGSGSTTISRCVSS